MFTNETITIARQDGELTDALRNKHGEPVYELFKPNSDEFWFLAIKTPEDGYEGECSEVVGIYLDREESEDAAQLLREQHHLPFDDISAFDYLYTNSRLEEDDDAEELKTLPAIQFINREHHLA